eukprot:339803_1
MSESTSIITGYITIYDVPDSCWSLIFQFCNVHDLVFNIASTNKFFQSLVVDQSTWIHRKVILPSQIYKPTLKKKTQNTLESMFLNWTSLKQLDIMLDPETDSERVTFIWRMLCTPRPKTETLRIGNSISLPGGDLSAVNETAFKYLKLIQDIEVLDFSFNMFMVSYEAIIDFFAAQAGQIYNPPPKPKRNYLSHWNAKQNTKDKNEKLNHNPKANESDRNSNTQSDVNNTNIESTTQDIDNTNTAAVDDDTTAESAVIEPQTVSIEMDEQEEIEEHTPESAFNDEDSVPKLVTNEQENKDHDDIRTPTPPKRKRSRMVRTPSTDSRKHNTNTNTHTQ